MSAVYEQLFKEGDLGKFVKLISSKKNFFNFFQVSFLNHAILLHNAMNNQWIHMELD